MLRLISEFPENVIAIEASGEVTAEDYQQVLVPAVENAVASHKRVRLFYLLGDAFSGFSGGAAWEDTKVGMRHFGDFERVAVVSDTDWIRTMVRGFGFALPGAVRVFGLEDLDDAEDWIRAPNDPGELEFELDEERGLLILEPRDELEAGDFERVAAAVDPYLDREGQLAGLVVITRTFPGWDDFAALSAHIGFVRGHHKSIRRVALVTDSHFLAALPRVASVFVHAEVRRFEADERSTAIDWATGAEG